VCFLRCVVYLLKYILDWAGFLTLVFLSLITRRECYGYQPRWRRVWAGVISFGLTVLILWRFSLKETNGESHTAAVLLGLAWFIAADV